MPSNGGFSVRRASARDLDTLVYQRHRMFEDIRHRPSSQHKIGDRSFREWARRRIKDGQLACYLATTSAGLVVAGGCVWLREEQPGPGYAGGSIPYVMSMYTDPRYRRKGLASLILKVAVRDARRRGYPRMTLHASKFGRKVYPKLGWKRGWEMYLELE